MICLNFFPVSISLIFVFASFCKAAHYIPVIDENYADCGHSGYLSLEGLELVALNGTHTALNGKIKINKEIHSPWLLKVSSQRYNRGQWHIGEVNRQIADLCLQLQQENEPWYPVTSQMKHKSCPIPPGTVEEFNMLPLVGFKVDFPPSFVGKWKVKLDHVFKDLPGMEKEVECLEISFEIVEA